MICCYEPVSTTLVLQVTESYVARQLTGHLNKLSNRKRWLLCSERIWSLKSIRGELCILGSKKAFCSVDQGVLVAKLFWWSLNGHRPIWKVQSTERQDKWSAVIRPWMLVHQPTVNTVVRAAVTSPIDFLKSQNEAWGGWLPAAAAISAGPDSTYHPADKNWALRCRVGGAGASLVS